MLRDPVTNTPIGPTQLGNTIYEYDWYSGSQIQVMIDDILIDNAVGVAYQVQQTKTPVFGYASQYYSFVSDGHVFVQGELTIAFKEAGYLFYAMARSLNARAAGGLTTPRYITRNGKMDFGSNVIENTSLVSASAAARRGQILRANVEQMAQIEADQGDPVSIRANNQFWLELGAMNDDAFEDWAEAFEDVLWYGTEAANPFTRDLVNSKNIPPGEILDDETIFAHRRLDQYPPIDIWIVYGDHNTGNAVNHTVKKLMDVSFIGEAETIEISGSPIFEQYSFIARNRV
jgi:hypothetical protein